MKSLQQMALLMLVGTASASASAQELNQADTAWVLTATALVLFMTIPGLSLFYGGLVRVKNVLSILMQCFALTCLMSLLWFAVGYTIAFGSDGVEQGAFIGDFGNVFFAAITMDSLNGGIPATLFAIFQMTFAIITPALIVGGFAERMRFSAMLLFSAIWLIVVYAPVCHWVWGGGWLGSMGLQDFAGGTVVHITAAVAALVAAMMMGPRRGFGKVAMPPHNLTMTVTGAGMLWVGWFGFNGGSQLAMGSVGDVADVSRIFANTNAAAAGGAVAALILTQLLYSKPDLTMILNGALAGLVSITAEPLTPSLGAATIIGAIGGVIVVFSVPFLDKLKIDDVVGAIPVHLFAGIWGTIAVVFTNGDASLGTQLYSIIVVGIFVTVASAIVWFILKATTGIRVAEEDEINGLDMSELGMDAYPEFSKS